MYQRAYNVARVTYTCTTRIHIVGEIITAYKSSFSENKKEKARANQSVTSRLHSSDFYCVILFYQSFDELTRQRRLRAPRRRIWKLAHAQQVNKTLDSSKRRWLERHIRHSDFVKIFIEVVRSTVVGRPSICWPRPVSGKILHFLFSRHFSEGDNVSRGSFADNERPSRSKWFRPYKDSAVVRLGTDAR